MIKLELTSLRDLKNRIGEEVVVSDWIEVTQAQIDQFAAATGDRQWIHVDVERARRESPFGAPIAHGFLTLSLLSRLLVESVRIKSARMGVNYGLNRVRFPNAVRVGSRVRLTSQLVDLKECQEGATVTYKQTIEVEGEDKPACVAEMMARLYF